MQEYQDVQTTSHDPDIKFAAHIGIGRSWLIARNYYEATKIFEEVIADFPNSPNIAHAYFFLSQAHEAQEHHLNAVQAFDNYLITRPGLIDAYIQDRRSDALFAMGEYSTAAEGFQAALQSPSQLDETLLQLKMARAYAVSGEFPTALTIYDDIYNRTSSEDTRALIDLRKGQAHIELGQVDLAMTSYMDAVENYPTSFNSYLALIELVEAGVTIDELQRGIVDYYAGQYGVGLAAFDRYLQSDPADPATAHYFYGLTSRALGGWQEANNHWDIVIQDYPNSLYWDDAWEQKAYTQWAFLDQYVQAGQTLLDFVDLTSDHPRAAEFLFDAALIAERNGQLEHAIELWERLTSQYPNYDGVMRSLFLAGITRYRLENYQSALITFQRYLSLATSLEDRSAAYFWMGKSTQALGNETTAQEYWKTAAGVDPTGYYSERARDILFDRQPFEPPLGYDIMYDAKSERVKAEEWLRQQFNLPENTDFSGLGPLANEASLQRGTELWELGLYAEARTEFQRLGQSYQLDPAQSYRLANYLVELGIYRSAIIAARQVLDQALMDDAATLNAPAYFSYLRFGTYYSDLIMPLAQDYGFHPLFFFSVVRQESLFESFIRSSADARGLMQIIPQTGIEIANNLGWPPDYISEDLFRPQINLTFGIDYMEKQRNFFNGDLYAALAAYNGGPGNASVWHEVAPNDPDLFLEVIRFPETRNYIRGIYEIFNIYRLIYDRSLG